jgi:hypothetical protein
MTDNCLGEKAQFRFLDGPLLQSIQKDGTLVCDGDTCDVYRGVSNLKKKYQEKGIHSIKQTAAGSLSLYNWNSPTCVQPSETYLLRKKYCNKREQEFTFGK